MAYPLDGVGYIIGDLFHCDVEGQHKLSTEELETFRRINAIGISWKWKERTTHLVGNRETTGL